MKRNKCVTCGKRLNNGIAAWAFCSKDCEMIDTLYSDRKITTLMSMMRAKIISRTRQYELANDAFYELKNILTVQDEVPDWVKDYINRVHCALEVRVVNAIIAGAKELEGTEDYEVSYE